jgi:transcriptional regulator with XRE-family HTH domain
MDGRGVKPLQVPARFWSREEVRTALVGRNFGTLFRLLSKYAGASQTQIAAAVGMTQGQVSIIMAGDRRVISIEVAERTFDGLDAPDVARVAFGLAPSSDRLAAPEFRHGGPPDFVPEDTGLEDELDAVELVRRVAATDVSGETLSLLEGAVDQLAVGYATTPALELQLRVARHLAYLERLLDGRATLAQRRRLLVVGAWLSLIRATLATDLRRDVVALAWLETCWQMAVEAEHAELRAWCLETRAWRLLGGGEFRQSVELSRAAQETAPQASSAAIQATAQEGRALARVGDTAGTRGVLRRIDKMVSALAMPDRPEHHYRYDPGKATAYTATTLAWSGDPAAVEYARAVVEKMERPDEGPRRPRRAGVARLDLALALIGTENLDEATATALEAIAARTLTASNWWRATEVVRAVERSGFGQAAELRDAYETFRPGVATPAA